MSTSTSRRGRPLSAILLALFLSAMDQTIVGTILPRVAADLGDPSHLYAWVFTAYLLTVTASAPIAGKLGDLRGHRHILLGGIAALSAASAAAALAWSMPVLVLCRAIQGVGGGLISASAFALLGDLYSLRDRGRMMGLFSGVYALASLIGPLLGGALADLWHWRAAFWLTVPLGLLAALTLLGALPAEPPRGARGPLDLPGAALLVTAVLGILLTCTKQAAGLALRPLLAVIGLGCAVAFVLVERRASEPLLPLPLFSRRHPGFALPVAITFLSAPGLYAASVFIPLFLQKGQGRSATDAGVVLLPMTVALALGSVVGGRALHRALRPLTVGGFALCALACLVLAQLRAATSTAWIAGGVSLLGLGYGLALPALSLTAQASAGAAHLGVSAACIQFARTLGGTVGVTLLGELFGRLVHLGTEGATAVVFRVCAAVLSAAAALAALLVAGGNPARATRGPEQGEQDG